MRAEGELAAEKTEFKTKFETKGGLLWGLSEADWLVLAGEVGGVAPGEIGEAEVEETIEVVEGDAHVEADLSGGKTFAQGFLHDGEGFEVKPTHHGIFDF